MSPAQSAVGRRGDRGECANVRVVDNGAGVQGVARVGSGTGGESQNGWGRLLGKTNLEMVSDRLSEELSGRLSERLSNT